MPELPEVEVLRRQLHPLLAGRTVTDAWASANRKFTPAADTVGLTFIGAERRGKYLLLATTSRQVLVLHLGMTGVLSFERQPWSPGKRGAANDEGASGGGAPLADGGAPSQATNPHLRAWWRLSYPSAHAEKKGTATNPTERSRQREADADPAASNANPPTGGGANPPTGDCTYLTYTDVRQFGRIALLDEEKLGSLPTLAKMGPEPLDPHLTAQTFWRRTRASNQRIKTQLLTQRPVAGVGNIYADEALHRAGINPALRRITLAQAGRLLAELRAVLVASIKRGGTSFRDYASLTGAGDNQQHLVCYGRAGDPCVTCASPLRRRVLDGRSTVWCPVCQRR